MGGDTIGTIPSVAQEAGIRGAETASGHVKVKADEITDWSTLGREIERENRSWGRALLIWGVIQFGLSLVDPTWGIAWAFLLLAVGGAAYYFRSLAMLPVYGTVMAWAMVSNAVTLNLIALLFAVLQAYAAFVVFRKFAGLRRAAESLAAADAGNPVHTSADPASFEAPLPAAPVRGTLGPDRAAGTFPWAGCALSTLALCILVAGFLLLMVYALTNNSATPNVTAMRIWMGSSLNLAALGLALGLAGLLARFRYRFLSIAATLTGVLVLIGFIVTVLLAP